MCCQIRWVAVHAFLKKWFYAYELRHIISLADLNAFYLVLYVTMDQLTVSYFVTFFRYSAKYNHASGNPLISYNKVSNTLSL